VFVDYLPMLAPVFINYRELLISISKEVRSMLPCL